MVCFIFLYMDQDQLQTLISEAERQGGGLVLRVGEAPQAVVLSVAAYSELLSGRTGLVPELEPQDGVVTESRVTPAKTILVVGGAGYIGSVLVRELLAAGVRVVVLDNLSSGAREQVPAGVVFIVGDFGDAALLRDVFAEYTVSAVVHVASVHGDAENAVVAQELLRNSTQALYTLTTIMAENSITDLVFTSDALLTLLGQLQPVVSNTHATLQPRTETALLAESVLRYASNFLGLRTVVMRLGTVAGAMPESGVYGTFHRHGFLAQVLRVARGVGSSVVIPGGDWNTNDGTYVRDYVFVGDVAKAVAAVVHAPFHAGMQVYAFGSGKGVSIRELIQAAAESTSRMIPMELGPRNEQDVERIVVDASEFMKTYEFACTPKSIHELIASEWVAPTV